jgi:hypothetical protein
MQERSTWTGDNPRNRDYQKAAHTRKVRYANRHPALVIDHSSRSHREVLKVMKLIKCCCEWEFVVSKKHVFGPIYAMGIGPYPTAKNAGMQMWTRQEFTEMYEDCDAHINGEHPHNSFKVDIKLPVELPMYDCPWCRDSILVDDYVLHTKYHIERNDEPIIILCYAPHLDSESPNNNYMPHVHVPKTDYLGRVTKIVWEDK